MRTHFHLTIISIVAGLLVGGSVSAQTIHHVSPRVIERTVQPGDIVTASVRIENTYAYRINVYPSVHGLEEVATGTSTEQVITTAEATPINDWLTMTRAAQSLWSGDTVDVAVRFTIPRSLEPGTYRGLLGFGQGINRSTAEKAVRAGTAPGVVLRFTVPEPDIQTDGAATVALSKIVLANSQPALQYRIHNPTNKPIIPTGEIIITDQRGAEVAAVSVNREGVSLAPGDVLSVATATPALAGAGSYKAAARIDYQSSQLAAVAISDTFWYLPWQLLLGIVCFMLLASVFLYRYLARHTRSAAVSEKAASVPLHIYEGLSPAEDHDINLKT